MQENALERLTAVWLKRGSGHCFTVSTVAIVVLSSRVSALPTGRRTGAEEKQTRDNHDSSADPGASGGLVPLKLLEERRDRLPSLAPRSPRELLRGHGLQHPLGVQYHLCFW